jgi:hypothetical protein
MEIAELIPERVKLTPEMVKRCLKTYRLLRRERDYDVALLRAMFLSTSDDITERVAAKLWFKSTAR